MLFHFCSCVVKIYLFIHSFIQLFALWIKESVLVECDCWCATSYIILYLKKIGKSLLVVVLLFLGLCFNLFMKPHFV